MLHLNARKLSGLEPHLLIFNIKQQGSVFRMFPIAGVICNTLNLPSNLKLNRKYISF